jgi:hypothetical protein
MLEKSTTDTRTDTRALQPGRLRDVGRCEAAAPGNGYQ